MVRRRAVFCSSAAAARSAAARMRRMFGRLGGETADMPGAIMYNKRI